MNRVLCCLCLICLRGSLGGLILHRGNEYGDITLADIVHSTYVDFGIQNISHKQNTTHMQLAVLTEESVDLLCQSVLNSTFTAIPALRELYEGKILLIPERVRSSCQPIDKRLSYLTDVCLLGAIIVETSWFLRLYSYLRPYDRFQSLSLSKNCTRLTIAEDPNEEILEDIREGNLTATLVVDVNPYVAMYETPIFRVLYNYLFGAVYLILAVYAAFLFCWRLVKCTITRIFAKILLASCLTCAWLAVVQIYGAHFTDNEISFEYVLVGYNVFFGTSVATSLLIVILYDELINDVFKTGTSNIQKLQVRCRLWTGALFLTVSDFLMAGLSFGVFSETTLLLLRASTSLLFIVAQIYVIVNLYKSSRKVLRFLSKNSANGVKSRLERHFNCWVKVSIGAASLNTTSLVAILVFVPLISPLALALCGFGLTIGKQLNILSQLKLCAPVKEKPKATVTATNVSSAGYISFAPNKQ